MKISVRTRIMAVAAVVMSVVVIYSLSRLGELDVVMIGLLALIASTYISRKCIKLGFPIRSLDPLRHWGDPLHGRSAAKLPRHRP